MMYIENIFICIAVPMLLSLLFIPGEARKYTFFVTTGMGMCMLSAYVNSFFMNYYGADAVQAAIEITPVCEEVMKLFPLLFYILIFEPKKEEIPRTAIALAVGFATFENICYMTENGAADFEILVVRGFASGALHILCGILMGFGITYIFRRRTLAITGMVGLLGACSVFQAIYNLLVSAEGNWRAFGYLFPTVMILGLFAGWKSTTKLKEEKNSFT